MATFKTAEEYREEFLQKTKDKRDPAERERFVDGMMWRMMVQDRDAHIRALEQRIVDLHHPPAMIKALDEKRARAARDLADPDTLESYRQSAIAEYGGLMHPPRAAKDVVLPDGEWPPDYTPEVFIRRDLGLSDDGLSLNLEHASCKDLPRPKISAISVKKEDNETPSEDDISGTFIGSLLKRKPD